MIFHANFLLKATKFGEITPHFVFIYQYLIRWSRSYRARNRWFVAYTLLRNLGLQELTVGSTWNDIHNTELEKYTAVHRTHRLPIKV